MFSEKERDDLIEGDPAVMFEMLVEAVKEMNRFKAENYLLKSEMAEMHRCEECVNRE